MKICKTVGCNMGFVSVEGHDYCPKCREVVASNDSKDIHPMAADFLKAGLQHMEERAVTYDAEDGERSIRKVVEMFNILEGTTLTEVQGWRFMILLKLVRSSQGNYKADNYEDGAAYFGLAGEAHARSET